MSICRSLTKSLCSSLSTSITPHGYLRPRTRRPSGSSTSLSLPTIIHGSYNKSVNKYCHLRVAGRSNEINTSVNSIINHLTTIYAIFLLEVCIKAGFDIFEDRFPANENPKSREISTC